MTIATSSAAPTMVGSATDVPRFRSWVEDYVSSAPPVPRSAVVAALRRRGVIDRLATSTSRNQAINGARIVVVEHADAQRRASDPFEVACTFLRRRGYIVCAEKLIASGRTGFRVGRHAGLSHREVIALAERLGATTPAASPKEGLSL